MPKIQLQYDRRRAGLIAAGVALGGARLEVAEGGRWRTYVQFPEEVIRAIVTPWLETGQLDLCVLVEDGGALSITEEGGEAITIDEPCLGLRLKIPAWAISPREAGAVPYLQVLAGLTGYHSAVRNARHGFTIRFARAVREIVLARSSGFINADFVFNREWVDVGEDFGIQHWQQVVDAFRSQGISLDTLESYVDQVARQVGEISRA